MFIVSKDTNTTKETKKEKEMDSFLYSYAGSKVLLEFKNATGENRVVKIDSVGLGSKEYFTCYYDEESGVYISKKYGNIKYDLGLELEKEKILVSFFLYNEKYKSSDINFAGNVKEQETKSFRKISIDLAELDTFFKTKPSGTVNTLKFAKDKSEIPTEGSYSPEVNQLVYFDNSVRPIAIISDLSFMDIVMYYIGYIIGGLVAVIGMIIAAVYVALFNSDEKKKN